MVQLSHFQMYIYTDAFPAGEQAGHPSKGSMALPCPPFPPTLAGRTTYFHVRVEASLAQLLPVHSCVKAELVGSASQLPQHLLALVHVSTEVCNAGIESRCCRSCSALAEWGKPPPNLPDPMLPLH